MIQFKNVSKVYENGTKALSNVNFTINSGEFVFLVGASGAGKTTAVKLILREILPTRGDYSKWQDITKLKRKRYLIIEGI